MNAPPPPPRRSVPASFGEEPTRQVDDELLTALRASGGAGPSAAPVAAPPAPPPSREPRSKPMLPKPGIRPAHHDEPTRLASLDSLGFDDTQGLDELTRPLDDFRHKFPPTAPTTDPSFGPFEDHRDPEEATRLASLDGIAAMERARNHNPSNDERTRAVNIRNDPSISDIDWDLD